MKTNDTVTKFISMKVTCAVAIFNNELYKSNTNNVKIQELRTEYKIFLTVYKQAPFPNIGAISFSNN